MLRILFYALFINCSLQAQQPFTPAHPDVQHYEFQIAVSDSSDRIEGTATIQCLIVTPGNQLTFDLTGPRRNGHGMLVKSVNGGSEPLEFKQENDRLSIYFKKPLRKEEKTSIRIAYEGIPDDGLIIARNKFGDRGFFADNWPNRAHNWIPCIDHPADKAMVDFIIKAPSHYQVVANGIQVEETVTDPSTRLTHYRETVPLACKVMAIGISDFAVQYAGSVNCIPVYSWVYPQEKKQGFFDYAQATEILPYYIDHIGPYAYEKLANVESKTRFGGLENANTIFYNEKSITGTRRSESLLAHEIAHQWFGNMVTEKDWPHLWLSEGFASYMTILYLQNKYGDDTARFLLKKDRLTVIGYAHSHPAPVVDTTVTDYMQLLNPNSYQKGSWVLHMIRQQCGDSLFWSSIRAFYKRYAGLNADTRDFQHILEEQTGRSWQYFFDQWLYRKDLPVLHIRSKQNAGGSGLELSISQLQDYIFHFPLCIEAVSPSGERARKTIAIKEKETIISWKPSFPVAKLQADPDCQLLFEEK